MKVTTTWELSDIRAGVKVVDGVAGNLNGTIVMLPGRDRNDGAIELPKFAIAGADNCLRTELMLANQLAQILTEKNCKI